MTTWPLLLTKDPPTPGLLKAVAIDREVAQQYPCPECGSKELDFDFSFRHEPFQYRNFTHCRSCGRIEEG